MAEQPQTVTRLVARFEDPPGGMELEPAPWWGFEDEAIGVIWLDVTAAKAYFAERGMRLGIDELGLFVEED